MPFEAVGRKGDVIPYPKWRWIAAIGVGTLMLGSSGIALALHLKALNTHAPDPTVSCPGGPRPKPGYTWQGPVPVSTTRPVRHGSP